MPSARPNTTRPMANSMKPCAAPTATMVKPSSTEASLSSGPLPYRRASLPAACMEISAPAAGQSNPTPSSPSLSPSRALNWGISVNQADSTKPTTKKAAATASCARWALARSDWVAVISASS